jgi:hypothetical protein
LHADEQVRNSSTCGEDGQGGGWVGSGLCKLTTNVPKILKALGVSPGLANFDDIGDEGYRWW